MQWNSLTEEVPQLLLGDFGRAARLSDPVYPASLQEDCIYARDDYDYVVPPAEKVRRHIRGIHEDIQGLGYLLLDMISTAVTYMGDNESYSIEDIIEDLSGEHDEVDAGNFSPLAPFSQELKDLIAHIFIDWNEVPDANYPDGHYLINHVIPTADRMFAQWQHQIPTRSIKTMRRPSAAKVAVAQIPHDLFGDPREGDVAKSMNTILAKGWTLLKVGIDIVDLRQPLWVTNFDMGDKYRGEWLIAANDTPAEELEPTMPNGTPVRVLESQVLRGWIRYLTEHAGEPEPRWLTHKDFPGDLRKLVHAFHLTYPDKSRGRQFCITALA